MRIAVGTVNGGRCEARENISKKPRSKCCFCHQILILFISFTSKGRSFDRACGKRKKKLSEDWRVVDNLKTKLKINYDTELEITFILVSAFRAPFGWICFAC